MRQLIWFRSDLRVRDNTALCAAMRAGPTLAVYLVSPDQWQEHGDAPCKVDFWLRNLIHLRDDLRRLGVPLLIRQADRWQDAPAVLANLCREWMVSQVMVNQEYGVNEARRDREVAVKLAKKGIHFVQHLDQLLFAPGSILTRTGGYFQVFSQFKKVCYQHLHSALPAVLATPQTQPHPGVESDPVPVATPGFSTPGADLQA